MIEIIPQEDKKTDKCPKCGAEFEKGKPVFYSCFEDKCPKFAQIRF